MLDSTRVSACSMCSDSRLVVARAPEERKRSDGAQLAPDERDEHAAGDQLGVRWLAVPAVAVRDGDRPRERARDPRGRRLRRSPPQSSRGSQPSARLRALRRPSSRRRTRGSPSPRPGRGPSAPRGRWSRRARRRADCADSPAPLAPAPRRDRCESSSIFRRISSTARTRPSFGSGAASRRGVPRRAPAPPLRPRGPPRRRSPRLSPHHRPQFSVHRTPCSDAFGGGQAPRTRHPHRTVLRELDAASPICERQSRSGVYARFRKVEARRPERSSGFTPSRRSPTRARASKDVPVSLGFHSTTPIDNVARAGVDGCLELRPQAVVEASSALDGRRRQQHSELLGAPADDDVTRTCDAFEERCDLRRRSLDIVRAGGWCTAIRTSASGRCDAHRLSRSRARAPTSYAAGCPRPCARVARSGATPVRAPASRSAICPRSCLAREVRSRRSARPRRARRPRSNRAGRRCAASMASNLRRV